MRLPAKAALLALIPLAIMTAIGGALFMQGKPQDGRSTIAVGVIIGAVSGASVLYQVESWSLVRQTLAHIAVMTVTVLPALLLSGWFVLASAADYLRVVGLFAVTGAVAWGVLYLVFGVIVPRWKRKPRRGGACPLNGDSDANRAESDPR